MVKEIITSRGMVAVIDDDMFSELSQLRWTYMAGSNKRTGYAVTGVNTPNGRRNVLMHRMVMGPVPDGHEVDHINGNGMDNRRENLRFLTRSQNKVARDRRVAKSGFKGVTHVKATGRYSVNMAIGTFETAEDAARAYDRVAVFLWGEFARLNFRPPTAMKIAS